MSNPVIRIKVLQKPQIRGKMDVRFPAKVEVENFLTVTKANGIYTFGVDYTKLAEVGITDPATAKIALLDESAQVYKIVSVADIVAGGLDADLQAIAALTGTGILERTGDDAWTLRFAPTSDLVGIDDTQTLTNKTLTSPVINSPTGIVKGDVGLGNVDNTSDANKPISTATQTALNGKQPLDATLTALAALDSTAGILTQTGADTFVRRSLAAPAAGLTITNPAGTAGNPTFALANDLAAVEGLSTTGIVRRTGTDAFSAGTAVANSELATMATGTFKGNVSGSTAAPSDLTATQVTAALNLATISVKGLAPQLPNDATKYLDGTGAYTVPAGSGGGSSATSILFGTAALAQAATIPSIVERIETAGYTAAGDGGGSIATNATYERVVSLPSHAGYIQSADGAYWELTGKLVSVKQFGAVAVVSNIDTDPRADIAINACIAYANLKSANVYIPGGGWPLDAAITSPTFIIEISGQQGSGQPTLLYKRYTEANASKGIISLGGWGATIRDIQFAAKSGVSGGSALSAILPSNAPNIGILRLRNIYSSCGDGINANLYINGTANTGGVGGTGGKSYRSIFLENCHLFGAAQNSVVLLSVEALFASNCLAVTSGGTMSGATLNCSGNAASPNDSVYWEGLIDGNVTLEYTTKSIFDTIVTGNLTNTANVSDVTVTEVKGTIGTSWVNSRVVNDIAAWVTSTPTPSSTGGAFTSASSSIAYKIIGKTVFCRGKIMITTVGTASGGITLQLPFTLKDRATFAGKETAVNGFMFSADVQTTGLMTLLKYDNLTNIAAGVQFPFVFVSELP